MRDLDKYYTSSIVCITFINNYMCNSIVSTTSQCIYDNLFVNLLSLTEESGSKLNKITTNIIVKTMTSYLYVE